MAAIVAVAVSVASPDGHAASPEPGGAAAHASVLTPGRGAISGIVRGDRGRAVAGATVTVSRLFDPLVVVASTSTRSSGRYTLPGLPAPFSYEVCVTSAAVTGPGVPPTGLLDQCSDVGGSQIVYYPHASVFVAAGQTTPVPVLTLVTGGAITGTVTNGSAPLAGVVVTAIGSVVSGQTALTERALDDARAAGLLPTSYTPNDNFALRRAVTGADGSYTLSGLPGGAAKVCFSGSAVVGGGGYQAACRSTSAMPGTTDVYVPVGVTPGQIVSAGEQLLERGTAITGRITGSDETSLAGITVTATPVHEGFPATAQTDALGRYRVAGLAGAYTICAEAPGSQLGGAGTGYAASCAGSPDRSTADVIDAGSSGVDVTLPVGGAINGTARRVDGSVVPYARVEISGRAGQVTFADRDGRYLLPGLVGGVYEVCFDHNETNCSITPADVTPGATTRVTQPLPNQFLSVTGTVTDSDGHPIADATVRLGQYQTARSAADGTFAFTDLLLGTYRLYADADADGYASNCTMPVPVTVSDVGTPPDVALVLPHGATITGTVRGAGAPMAGADVRAVPVAGCFGAAVHAVTDPEGHYVLVGQPAGTVSIRAVPSQGQPAPGFSAGAATVATTAGGTARADVDLPVAGALAGTVHRPDGTVVAGERVSSINGVYSTITGPDGRYVLAGIGDAGVKVCYRAPASGADRDLLDQCDPKRRRGTIALPRGATVTHDVTLVAGAAVVGSVRSSDGRPLGGVAVRSDDFLTRARSGPDGTYRIDQLAGTSVQLCFLPSAETNRTGSTGYQYRCYADAARRSDASRISTPPGETVTADVALPDGAAIAGTVLDQNGDPVPGALVEVDGYDRADVGAVSRADGRYLLTGLVRGSTKQAVVYPFFSSSDPLPGPDPGYVYPYPTVYQPLPVVKPGVRTTGVGLAAVRAGGISGRVTNDAGAPIGDVLVTVTVSTSLAPFHSAAYVEPDGSYSLATLPAGHARVCFGSSTHFRKECYDNVATLADATPIPVRAGAFTSGIDAVLAPS